MWNGYGMTTQEAIATASVLGTLAFKDGKKAIPAHDKNLMALIGENSTHMGWAIPVLKAWSKSFHAAIVAQPFEK